MRKRTWGVLMHSYRSEVIQRFMSSDEFAEFKQRYIEARKKSIAMREPNKQDIHVLTLYRSGKSIGEIAQEIGRSKAVVRNCLLVSASGFISK